MYSIVITIVVYGTGAGVVWDNAAVAGRLPDDREDQVLQQPLPQRRAWIQR